MKKWYINEELTELRKSLNMNVEEFCKKAAIDQNTYFKMQQGKHFKTDAIKIMAKALNLNYGMDEDGSYLYEESKEQSEASVTVQLTSYEKDLLKQYRKLNWEDKSIVNQLLQRLTK